MFNFSGSGGSFDQSDRGYASTPGDATWTLSDEIAFVIQPGKTRGYVKKPARKQEKSGE